MWNSQNSSASNNDYSNNFSTSSNGGGNKFNSGELGQNLVQIDWNNENLQPFQKVFYKESERKRNAGEIELFYSQNNISTKSPFGKVPEPFLCWTDAHFPQYIMNEVESAKFEKPSPIQSLAFPVVLSGHDLIGIAQTGSGKTLSFLLPSIVHINSQTTVKKGDGPIVLVLAPTRELAMQIKKESEKFGKSSQLKSACIYGGVDKSFQRNILLQGIDVIIATPGRLIDFLESQTTNLRRVTYLVLDEADRMLDMGFEPQIRKILGQIRPDRQTLMFSATWPKNVQSLANDYCKNTPVYIQIGKHELSVNERIKQIVYVCESFKKINLLIKQLVFLTSKDKALIFSQTKKGCENLGQNLNKEGYYSLVIHGDKSQKERDFVMNKFKNGECKILIATDVASRGLDVKDVSHVFNFDFPKLMEDYVHRIGRTGRGGAYGCAISFLTAEQDKKISREFVQMLHDAKQEIPDDLHEISETNPKYRHKYKAISADYYDIKKYQNENNECQNYSNKDAYNNNSRVNNREQPERSRSPHKQDNNRWIN